MSEMTTVLVVDDEPIVRDVVVRYLQRDGFDTLEAADGESARRLIEEGSPQLVVLDVMLPGTDGLALCRWIRSRGELPVIMLTARGEEADRIVGLELGADDYVPKPFSPRELLARLRAVLRRTAPSGEPPLVVGNVSVDLQAREVRVSGGAVELTAFEFDLLVALARRPGRVVPREVLLEEAGRGDVTVSDRTVDVHVSHLRRKLGDDPRAPRLIKTVRGAGYVLAREPAS